MATSENAGTQPELPTPESSLSQYMFREVNDRINAIADCEDDAELELLCECEGSCLERFSVSRETYALIRRFPSRFLIKPGHAPGRAERVVVVTPQFMVVENTCLGAVPPSNS